MTYDLIQNQFIYQAYLNSLLPTNMLVTALAYSKNNLLWVGSVDGVIKYNTQTLEGKRLTNYDGLAGNDISCIFVDKSNTIWIGAKSKGLTSITDTIITQVSIGEGVTPSSITEDNQGNLWIGTMGQGLLVYNKSYIVRTYTEANGLLSNLINLVCIDNKQNVYIGTNKGLNRFDSKEKKIYTYTRKNGFTGIETKPNAVCFDNNNNLWFGTVNGVIKYQREYEKIHTMQPLTHITRIRVNLEDVSIKNKLSLSYKQNAIIFDYHSICLTNPEAVRYQVMLDGADAAWQPVTEQTMASYPALPPRKYTFKVRARNSDGIWNSSPIAFEFEIKPPFYKTWWFIIICIASGTLLIMLYIKWREQKLIEEKKVLEQKVTERTHEIHLKNNELALTNSELASKNKNITDSIRYAKRIQIAILPFEIPYPDTFIFFKPKDIVSGDFYWLLNEGGYEFMAAVDCTGHGVPGAFMSIIGHILLNKIVKEYKILKPGEILDALNYEIIETLHNQPDQSFSVNDGMDISIVCYEPATHKLNFAGAFNPIYIVRNGEIIEHPANRYSIGRHTGPDKKFSNNEIAIETNDMLYLFSDGYEDQFGGERGKKFKAQGMKDLFIKIANRPTDNQKQIIDQTFENWKGDLEQIDDVLVIGRRF
jgi:ligand-binding sensor domain-containing protein